MAAMDLPYQKGGYSLRGYVWSVCMGLGVPIKQAQNRGMGALGPVRVLRL